MIKKTMVCSYHYSVHLCTWLCKVMNSQKILILTVIIVREVASLGVCFSYFHVSLILLVLELQPMTGHQSKFSWKLLHDEGNGHLWFWCGFIYIIFHFTIIHLAWCNPLWFTGLKAPTNICFRFFFFFLKELLNFSKGP